MIFKPGDKAADLHQLFKDWCKETKRSGGILVGSSVREFLTWLSDLEPLDPTPVQEEEIQLDYPAAARVIALWLKEYCDENLSYPNMIAECARRASKEISRLKSELEELKRKA